MDCNKCYRRGKINGSSQETYCSMCVYGTPWKKNFYSEGPAGGKPDRNCDGCARDLPVINGIHRDELMKYVCACTANIYTQSKTNHIGE